MPQILLYISFCFNVLIDEAEENWFFEHRLEK